MNIFHKMKKLLFINHKNYFIIISWQNYVENQLVPTRFYILHFRIISRTNFNLIILINEQS